ncbi:UDP-N-acetylglucosamine 2-epimerase (non-hydrolyzing) [Pseudoflavitalea sp. G-6-1-2]|uniref:non-hydrolyzing UDP-N-acetylglucosamine 2-epimerase n=1 Tax=Pseudoflavitalea sp. G-6-1-2 TaxID=2728841 RepID=UPI00146F160B|nr:UDP-N-acetylglucosamine 2-epimerase (non-hydrolyzing) [Pseudoflavitalea sp. G-6-1-2]NML20616.1 UDP-N-acetylglucosamine 2-epimerase (non-hydrolyzing) [Pseudoflavitalea sp. G-6-1-2]
MRLTLIAGARPNFIKIAPLIDAIKAHNNSGKKKIDYRLVHTGQHYDRNMSESFFKELGISEPDDNLGAGGGTQAEQTANIMVRFEEHLRNNPTDCVLVVGDVTSTLACSIVAKKMVTDVAHVEAGIRSGDLAMPEEINRMVTDAITDHFFTTSHTANENLQKSGVPDSKVHFVGNVMIDSLLKHQPRFTPPAIYAEKELKPQQYFVLTLHRPSNVDDPTHFFAIIQAIMESVKDLPVIFPVHPRTARNIEQSGIVMPPNLVLAEPMSYLQFNYLVQQAKAVITDSGGITEETTVMGIPCITLRNSTERPETVTIGTNELIGANPAAIAPQLEKIMEGKWKKGGIPELWDGKASERIIAILSGLYS